MFPRIHFSVERWRKNREYGVWVSTKGRVRLIKNKQYLTPRIDKKGYCLVFTDKGSILVHRLVAYTWLGDKRNEKYTIDHINSNKRDNCISNLRWMPAEINQAYAIFTKCDDDRLEETAPQTSIEQTEQKAKRKKELERLGAFLNANKTKEECASTFIKKLNTGAIKVFYNTQQLTTYEDVLSKKKAIVVDDTLYIHRLVHRSLHDNASPYFGGKWRIEIVDN